MARILVVDAEERVQRLLREALEADGHEPVSAGDGEEALRELGDQSFELMFTSLQLPGVDGLDLMQQAHDAQPDLEVVVMTGQGSTDAAVRAMERGAFEFLQKPIKSPAELRLLAERALERRELLAYKERESLTDLQEPPLTYGDKTMVPVVNALEKVAPTEATVLLIGESGTGKELAARTVHRWSRRSTGPFVAINCAALSETLLESELFGHEKGAFTGAATARRGRIELAAGGTFFLDEIGELKLELQAKLLRVVQERCFERLGGTRTIAADVRWVAASNRDLEAMVDAGTFREDLYHRLAVFPIELPPLRERRADLLPLARTLLRRIGADLGKLPLDLADNAEQALLEADWRGNVRELANALERSAIVCSEHLITAADLNPTPRWRSRRPTPPAVEPAAPPPRTLEAIEREAIEQTLARVDGNRRKAAEQLGIGLRTLYEKLKRYDIA